MAAAGCPASQFKNLRKQGEVLGLSSWFNQGNRMNAIGMRKGKISQETAFNTEITETQRTRR